MGARARVVVLLACAATACSRGAPTVGEVQVAAGAEEEALRAAGLDAETLRAASRESLRRAGFRLAGGQGAYRARVEIVSPNASRLDGDPLEIAVELQLSGGRLGPLRSVVEVGAARVPDPGRDEAAAWREGFSAAVADAAAGVLRAIAAEAKPLDALVRDLEGEDPSVREHAIRVLGDRRSRDAVPGLIRLLRDPDLAIAERAVGALAQIGDPRAVGPIIDFTQRLEEGPYAPRYSRIIGDIGGSEARGYLLTVESGASDPRAREAARAALEQLEAREREQAAMAAPPRTTSNGGDSGRMER